MTPLAEILRRRIAATGPITVAEFMAECLLHPEHGYYTTRNPFGRDGDFTTAPEISQMFGELIGLALAQAWIDQGSAPSVVLAELGPGRGTLMADVLRATRNVPGFHQALRPHLVEASPALRKVQKTALGGYSVNWLDSAAQLPDLPLFLIANEFFDALPVRQFQRDPNGWREVHVAGADNALDFALSAPAPVAALDHRLEDTKPGDIVELRMAAAPVIAEISTRIEKNGGCALIFDYGDWRSLGDTLQALRKHKPEHPLENPGLADLTSHVDFEALATAASAGVSSAMATQGDFLQRLGIAQRARTLADKLSGKAQRQHLAAYRRLTDNEEMGTLFKALGLYPKSAATPPGFEP